MKKNQTLIMRNNQKGIVLIVGLIMLLLITIIGLAAIRGSGMQELMAGNFRDRNLAFQAAEAGLRSGESAVATSGSGLVFNGTNGLWEDLNKSTAKTTPPLEWTDANWTARSAEANVELYVIKKPRYVIEKVESVAVVTAASGGCIEFSCAGEATSTSTYYRITSLGYGGTESSQVVLQSTLRN